MPRPRRALAYALALCLLSISIGCSGKLARQSGLTDTALLSLGERNAEQKKWADAAEAFQLLIERFPTSPLAARAQFGLASSRMANGDDVEAEVAFDDFLRLYPADPKVPDALFLKGDLFSRQAQPPGRDQTKTHEAIKAYSRSLAMAPASPRAAEGERKIRELRNRLALHECAVVSHYLSRKLYAGAETRARRALLSYPDVPATPELVSLLAQVLEKEGKKEDAAEARKMLAEKYPEYGGKKQIAVSGLAGAGDPGSSYRGRKDRYEFTLQPRYIVSKEISGDKGASIEIDQDVGFGFGFGYNFTNKLALALDWSWASRNYRGKIAANDNTGTPGFTTASGTLDTSTIALNLSYYFLDGPVTPFVLGGIGWTFVDSNIAAGAPQGVCWWDPWYGGYYCTTYQDTYTRNYLSYNLGLGARWDVKPGFFLRGSVGWQWVDLGRAGTTDFMGGRMDLGFMF